MSDEIQRSQTCRHPHSKFVQNRRRLQEYTECVICFDECKENTFDYYVAESSCMSYAWGNGSPQEGQVLFVLTVKSHKLPLVLTIPCLRISSSAIMSFDFKQYTWIITNILMSCVYPGNNKQLFPSRLQSGHNFANFTVMALIIRDGL